MECVLFLRAIYNLCFVVKIQIASLWSKTYQHLINIWLFSNKISIIHTFWISLIHRLTPFCSWLRNDESSTFSPKSATLGLRPSSAHRLMTVATVWCTGREISGMSMFCCRCSNPISSSAIFFSTEGAILSPSLQIFKNLPVNPKFITHSSKSMMIHRLNLVPGDTLSPYNLVFTFHFNLASA